LFFIEFSNAVASFKSTYQQKIDIERISQAEEIIQKYIKLSDVGKKFCQQSEYLKEVLELKSVKIDLFDKLMIDMLCKKNKSGSNNNETQEITKPVTTKQVCRVSTKRLQKGTSPATNNPLIKQPSESSLPSERQVPSATIIVRRFSQKRGGEKIPIPGTMKELIVQCSDKLKIEVFSLREADTEAEISDLIFLKPDMHVCALTEAEEREEAP